MQRDRQIARRRLKTALLGGAAAMLMAGAAMAQDASIRFDIAAQDAGSALNDFSRQSGVRVLFPYDAVAGKHVPAMHGDMTIQAALDALTKATGLVVAANDGQTVTLTAPQSGSAAGDGADQGTVQALIVTAQKREEDIQDVPIAISAFTQEDLTRSQVAGGPDLVTQVPNFTFTKTNFSSYSIQIRGIGTQAISATTDPAVAVAFNNTPFIRNRFFEQEFYDLERVEVLRGPQGTLYGRNATAGVVNIISAKPKFRYEAKLSGDLGNYSSSRVEGMVNIPLVEDKIALRIAGAWTKRDGYVTNEITASQTDGRDLWSTRVSLRVQPTDRLNMNLIWEHFQEDDDRLRSGKQLCHKDVVTHVGDVPITNYFDVSNAGGQGLVFAGIQPTLSQGCVRYSLYDQGSFQRPNGMMLPYYLPLSAIGLPAALTDPYAAVVDCVPGHGCDMAALQSTNDQPQNLRVIQSTLNPQYRAKNDLGELQIGFDLTDALTLTSETAYSTDQVFSLQDFNRFNTASGAWSTTDNSGYDAIQRGVLDQSGVFCDPQLGCSDRLVAEDISTAKSSQFSQEFRLGSNFEGPFNFSFGVNFLRADSEDKYYVFFNSISLLAARGLFQNLPPYVPGKSDNAECLKNGYLPGNPDSAYPVQDCVYMDPNPIGQLNDKGHNYFLSKNPYKLISYAMFGEGYYNISDNLKLTAGLRWTVDKKEAPRIPSWVLASQSVGYPVQAVIRQEWREPTGRLTLDWKPSLSFTDQTLVYGSLARGYKAGGANPPGFVREYYADVTTALKSAAESATRPRTFEPEFVNAFEFGTKNTLDDGHVTVNLAAFYYDYTGYQVSEIVDRSAFNRNFDATVWGAELETEWRPVENLKLGFKGGYEKTRIADGEQAIDLMDRTAGNPNWLVVRPFPTYASSCILPTYVFANPNGTIAPVGGVGGGGPGGCEIAYQFDFDPVTYRPYVDLTSGASPGPPTVNGIDWSYLDMHPGYPGFNPATAPNGGEGFFKQLGGNELPNAPHFTATVTGDYTLPLANDWLMTLHSDVHWQSQSWWRVFNDSTYDKLHPYFTMNLAAIFTNEDAGWNIMAYLKNVTDETAITGAFLNSDDTGLTTNVFLTEPRLYGLRVTKNWSGGPLLGNFEARHEGPYLFTVELGGQISHYDAPNQAMLPSYTSAFAAPLDIFDNAQNTKLDWGDSREINLTYRPSGSPWAITAALRKASANKKAEAAAQWSTEPICLFEGFLTFLCTESGLLGQHYSAVNRADAAVVNGEGYEIADLAVARDFSLPALDLSSLGLGLRRVNLRSATAGNLRGIPDWDATPGSSGADVVVTHSLYNIDISAHRKFEGLGPMLFWRGAYALLSDNQAGRLDMDWAANGGVIFGSQKTFISGVQSARPYGQTLADIIFGNKFTFMGDPIVGPPIDIRRSDRATVMTVGAALGLSYEIGRVKVGTGYRWERYFDALDVGFTEEKKADRTIDGPYFKIAVGFGG
jgi:outer membrane receptor protein involved in Fe transport